MREKIIELEWKEHINIDGKYIYTIHVLQTNYSSRQKRIELEMTMKTVGLKFIRP